MHIGYHNYTMIFSRREIVSLFATMIGLHGENNGVDQKQTSDSESTDLLAQLYAGAYTDRPSPGVKGRYYHVTESGQYEGDLYRDTGLNWEPVVFSVQNGTVSNHAPTTRVDENLSSKYNDVRTVGPQSWTEYSSLEAAFIDLEGRGGPDNRYALELVSDLTNSSEETSQLGVPNYVDLFGRGRTIDINVNSHGLDFGKTVGEMENLDVYHCNYTVRHVGEDPPEISTTVRVRKQAKDVTLENVVAYGNPNGRLMPAFHVRNAAAPTFIDCEGYGAEATDGENRKIGLHVVHTARPKILGGIFQGGSDPEGNSHIAASFRDSCRPTIEGTEFIAGRSPDGYGVEITDNAAPMMSGVTIHPLVDSNKIVAVGDTSMEVSGKYRTRIRTIEYNMFDGPSSQNGATVDIGTSPNGNEIISDGPIDEPGRHQPSYNQVTLNAGSQIYVTPTDQDVQINVRYTYEFQNNRGRGLFLDTVGPADISNCNIRGTSGSGVYITDQALDDKRWTLSNSSCRTSAPFANAGIKAESDDDRPDPIYYCAAIGGTENITPSNG